jgi:hypothetical protein
MSMSYEQSRVAEANDADQGIQKVACEGVSCDIEYYMCDGACNSELEILFV